MMAPISHWLAHGYRVALSTLAPGWRWMLIILGSSFLYHATVFGGAGHGQIAAWRGILSVLCGLLAFGCLGIATRPAMPLWLRTGWERMPHLARWPIWRAALTVYLLWVPWHGFFAQLPDLAQGRYHNDAIAYVHLDADLLRTGHNPYTTDDAFWQAAARWPATGATPLLGSPHFGNDPLHYPSTQAQEALLRDQLAYPAHRGGDFDPRTVHNYPAGIIWLALPLVWLGLPSVIWLNFLALAAVLALLLARAPPEVRLSLVVAFAASPILWLFTLLENFDVTSIVFVLAAWQYMRHTRVSPLFLGLGCAVKQIAWFFAPLYLLEIYRREGGRAALVRAGWLALGFLIPNLPFIIAAPGAWFHSLLVPQTDAFFPIGYGLIDLALGGIVPTGSSHIWTALEVAALIGLLSYLYRRRAITADGLWLALIPLWLAWRSPMNYFAFMPVLALWMVVQIDAPQQRNSASMGRQRAGQ